MIGARVRLCHLLFKVNDSRKGECELRLGDERIGEADEHYKVDYDPKRQMSIFSVSHFASELKGVYKCVVSTAEEPTVSTSVEVVINCKFIGTSCMLLSDLQ
jgi:hypothetical protein